MAKRGGSHHFVRLTASRKLPIVGRKTVKWMLAPMPGTHPKKMSFSAGVLLRDVLGIARDMKEVKRMLAEGSVLVDGKKIHEPKFSIGLMDIVELPKAGKAYRLQIDGTKLAPKEIKAKDAKIKLCKVVSKRTVEGGKIAVGLHDGRTLLADNNVRVGATLRMSIPDFKVKDMLPFEPGVKCLVTDGTHAGENAVLEKIIERVGSMDSEAQVRSGKESFITVTKYLFVVDNEFA